MALKLRWMVFCALALVDGAISAATFEHGATDLVVSTMSEEPMAEQHLMKFDTWFPGDSVSSSLKYKNEISVKQEEVNKCAMWYEKAGCEKYQLDAHQQVRGCDVLGSVATLKERTSRELDMSVKALRREPNGVFEGARMAQQNMQAMVSEQVDQLNYKCTCHNFLYFDDVLDSNNSLEIYYDVVYFPDIDLTETYDPNFDFVVVYDEGFVLILEYSVEEHFDFYVNVSEHDCEPLKQFLEKYALNILLWLVVFILDILDYVVKVVFGLLRGQSEALLKVLTVMAFGFGVPRTIALLCWCMSPTRTYVYSGLQVVFWMSIVLWRVTEARVLECSLLSVMLVCIILFLAISNRSMCSAIKTKTSNRCDKRKERKVNVGSKRKLVALIFMCNVFHSGAMEQQQTVLERITTLAEAATRAAIAAERVARQTPASSSSGDGLQAASKVLKSPESVSGEDALNFPSWRFQFTSWLTYGESKYVTMLQKMESLATAPDIATYSPEERDLAHRLYAVPPAI